MSLPDPALHGPVAMTAADVTEVNRVFSDAFTDRYHRDGMTTVRVPELNPAIWRYALNAAGHGAMIWRDAGGIAAFNLVHDNGVEGWMGPLAVRTDRQGHGLGQTMVKSGVAWLKGRGCRTIGLETMPRTVENIGFYSGLGFRPGHLTITLNRELTPADSHRDRLELATTFGPPSQWLDSARDLVRELRPGLDLSRELALTVELGLGDVTVYRQAGQWHGFALWHGVPLSQSRPSSDVRMLKVVARDRASFRAVVEGVLVEAKRRLAANVTIRCQTAFRDAYSDLLALGYRVQWTDLRMVYAGHEEGPIPGAIVFSNWEI